MAIGTPPASSVAPMRGYSGPWAQCLTAPAACGSAASSDLAMTTRHSRSGRYRRPTTDACKSAVEIEICAHLVGRPRPGWPDVADDDRGAPLCRRKRTTSIDRSRMPNAQGRQGVGASRPLVPSHDASATSRPPVPKEDTMRRNRTMLAGALVVATAVADTGRDDRPGRGGATCPSRSRRCGSRSTGSARAAR